GGLALAIRSVLAKFGAQLGLDVGRAWHLDAGQLQPLQLGQQAASSERRKALQKFPDTVDLHPGGLIFRISIRQNGPANRASIREKEARKTFPGLISLIIPVEPAEAPVPVLPGGFADFGKI